MTSTEKFDLEPVLRVEEVAEHFGVQPGTIYRLIREGSMRCVRVGRLVRVPRSALNEFVAVPR